jgi:hypothetical protein
MKRIVSEGITMAKTTLKEKIRKFLQLDLNKKNYVSELDQFLIQFNQSHLEPSQSQRKEVSKAEKIAKRRDFPQKEGDKSKIWAEF